MAYCKLKILFLACIWLKRLIGIVWVYQPWGQLAKGWKLAFFCRLRSLWLNSPHTNAVTYVSPMHNLALFLPLK